MILKQAAVVAVVSKPFFVSHISIVEGMQASCLYVHITLL